ncbi:MAG: AEC family transporter [Verrucomicrobia bacterium]|nr:AEC family transporter [Verrucomicrobiota bacterium]
MMSLSDVLSAVLPVFCLALIGIGLRRVRWLTEEADATLLRLVVNVLTPCLIFDKVLGNRALQRAENLFIPPLIGFGGIVLGIGTCWLFRRRVGLKTDPEQRTFALVAGLQNFAYVPFPLVLMLFANHPDTPGVLFVHNLGVDIAMWTLGLITLGHATGPGEWRKLINAPLVAIILSLLINSCDAAHWVPRPLSITASMLGACTFPLGILLTGAMMADQIRQLNPARATGTLISSAIFRLGVLPALMLGIARVLPCSVEIKRVIVVQAAMPAGIFPIVLSRLYGGDPATAVRIVAGTTILSLITIPLWIQWGIAWLHLAP